MQKPQPSLEFPMDLVQYAKDQQFAAFFGREVQLTKVIYSCDKFQIEDKITAYRVAKALDRYVFLITNFDNISSEIYQEKEDKFAVDKWDIFSKTCGLDEVLGKLQTGDSTMSKQDKIRVLLELHQQVSSQIGELTPAEQEEAKTVQTLLQSSNPLSNGLTFCQKFFLFLLIAIVAILLGK